MISGWIQPTSSGGGSGRSGSSTESFSAQQNNHTISLTALWFYWTATSAVRHVTGLVASTDGDIIYVKNVGSTYAVMLDNLSGSSTAGNQFDFPSAVDYPIPPGAIVGLVYCGNSSKWNIFSTNNGA